MSRWLRRERGQAMVEFVLILPLMMTLLFGIVELADGLNTYLSVVAAARDGARIGSRGATDTAIIAAVQADLGRLRDTTAAGDIKVTRSTVGTQKRIRVQVCHNHHLVVNYPLLPLPEPMRMCSETTMRVHGGGS